MSATKRSVWIPPAKPWLLLLSLSPGWLRIWSSFASISKIVLTYLFLISSLRRLRIRLCNPSSFFIDSHLVEFVEQSKIVFWCMESDTAVQAAPQPLKSSVTYRASCLPLGRNIYVLPFGITSTVN
ncbi:hypothetical protein B0H14DRAFT_67167 [Mycena olivaceomarginata]|nr:hypothetical protein B0H14DRAFT_67167 [Mycena olivaceomarginata]